MYYKTPNTEVYDSAWVVSEIDPIFIDTKNKVFHLDGITAHRNETLFLYYFSFKLILSISQRSSHGDR